MSSVAIATGAAFALETIVGPSDLAMLYVAAVVVSATFLGRWPAVVASALSVAAYDFCFIPPRYTFAVSDTRNLVTFAMMFVLGILIAELNARARRNEEAARAAALRAQEEEVRSSLLSAVSHDLRTPLATITGAASTLREDAGKLGSAERTELLDALTEEAERMDRMVKNLLDMTRVASGRGVQLRAEWVPLEELVGSALTRLERVLGGRAVTTAIAEGLPLLSVDPVLFEQVLVNLFENAAKHTPAGSAIEVTARAVPGFVEITVADRGPGFSPGDEEKVFEKFHRGAKTTAPGAGLGLAIVRGIVKAHGGSVRAENRTEGGAAIVLRVPSTGEAPTAPREEAEA